MKKIILLVLLLALASCAKNTQKPIEKEQEKIGPVNSLYDIDYNAIEDADIEKDIYVEEVSQTFNDTELRRYMYTDADKTFYPAGMPLVIKSGNAFKLNVTNNAQVDTNIHWHGLSLPNDQDGPHLLIDKEGGQFQYNFTPDYSGTYWYHSHNRPVRDQVDLGMHGPLVILNEEDKQYSLDRIMMLDDWVVNRVEGHMQVEGDTDTVNGLTGKDIEPIVITNNDFVKLRLIQASTAKNTRVDFPFEVRVTHTDGIKLEKPYTTKYLVMSPGERYDIDFRIEDKEDQTFEIKNERDQGFNIPVVYTYETEKEPEAVLEYQTERVDSFVKGFNDAVDITVRMDSQMSHGKGHEWTINGEVFPYAEEFYFKKGQEYKIRFMNESRMFNHPMHIHGAHFKPISMNGTQVDELMWKDTMNILPGEYLDVLIRFDREGKWMLHCHILDHEDGGMMTTINVD